MSISAILYTPLVLLLPIAGTVDGEQGLAEPLQTAAAEQLPVQHVVPDGFETSSIGAPQEDSFRAFVRSFKVASAHQVRIEQRMTIRITPSAPRVRAPLRFDAPTREIGPRFEERRIGKCVPVEGIAGVQPDSGQRLILFMRDRRIVNARLERACQARDFYSGFYLSRSTDGKLCVDRDTLQSRSGAKCKITRMRQLVEAGN